ncbi:MAG: sulfite exporter TauE/SafE family protein, partial [Polyangiaceae bacterium]
MIPVLCGTGAIGVSIGLVGIGGVFLIPLLVWSGLPLETAIGTSLLTFTVTGVIATVIYAQGGGIDWRATLLASAGSLVSGTFGAKLSTVLSPRAVTACFAFFVLVSAFSALFGSRRSPSEESHGGLPGPAALIG